MDNKKKVFILLGIFLIIGVSFLCGLWVGQVNAPKTDIAIREKSSQTFYATIEEIKEYNGVTRILVKGLEVNDINYRGNYSFSINDNTVMTWRGEKINISDLKVGDNISITFTDEILNEISPIPLKEVIKVQLLEDEK